MSREFGIYPENITPRQWWGARALIEKEWGTGKWRFSLLPDRQNYERQNDVSDTDKDDFFFFLSHDMDDALQHLVATSYSFRNGSESFIFESESGRFHCEANPRNSGGYLYIGCWEK